MISKRIIIMISVVGFFFFHSFITYFTCALNNCTEQASLFSCACLPELFALYDYVLQKESALCLLTRERGSCFSTPI